MNVARLLYKLANVVPEHRLLEIYPLFLVLGLKVRELSEDYRRLHVTVPLRWLTKNMHGSMFGGAIAAVTDPLAALLAEKQFPGVEVWTKTHCVTFERPARTQIHIVVEVSDGDLEAISRELEAHGKTVHEFRFEIRDDKDHLVAEVKNGVYLRLHDRRERMEAAMEEAPDPSH